MAIAAWLGANLISWGEICNWASLLHFLFTDRTDEYQLVNYIIFSKICHFVAFGLIPGARRTEPATHLRHASRTALSSTPLRRTLDAY